MQITDTGIVIDRLDEIHARLVQGFKTIYGQDIVIDADTPDGQLIGLFSQALADINEVIAFAFQMLDPYQATGAFLEQRSLYAGVIRGEANYSLIDDVAITGRRQAELPKNTILIDGNRIRWVTNADVVLDDNGSARVAVRSEDKGVFVLPANSSLQLEVVLSGITGIQTLVDATPGREEESDARLQRRFAMSHSVNNNDDQEGIQAALGSLPNIEKVLVLENYESLPDPETGLPPHSVNAIVAGGLSDDVALVLLKKKIGGAAFFGKEEVTLRYKDMNRVVRFDRAEKVPVTVSLVYERLVDQTDLGQITIENILKSTSFDIHQNVYAQKLGCGINTDRNFNLLEIKVNGGSRVQIGWREYAAIDTVEIEIV